jgi:hypothetical protein
LAASYTGIFRNLRDFEIVRCPTTELRRQNPIGGRRGTRLARKGRPALIEEIRDEWGAAIGAVILLLGLYMTAGLSGICAASAHDSSAFLSSAASFAPELLTRR